MIVCRCILHLLCTRNVSQGCHLGFLIHMSVGIKMRFLSQIEWCLSNCIFKMIFVWLVVREQDKDGGNVIRFYMPVRQFPNWRLWLWLDHCSFLYFSIASAANSHSHSHSRKSLIYIHVSSGNLNPLKLNCWLSFNSQSFWLPRAFQKWVNRERFCFKIF